MTQRLKRHPFLALFDGPDPNASTADRRLTTVPTQALYFLNSPFVHEKADKFAGRLRSARPDDAQRVERGWWLAMGRAPTESERAEAAEFLAVYRADLIAAGQSNAEPAALAAYNNAGLTQPSVPHGVHTTISLQPATRPSVTVINAVETSGAAPPGI